MKTLSDLKFDTAINLATAGTKIDPNYPDNEWGIMLAHFDSCVAVYQHAKVETKYQGLQQEDISSQTTNENDGDWQAWNKDNPNVPNIPHNPVIYEASVEACTYFADAPPPLRNCMSVLANGGDLSEDDWPVFLLMYGEFRTHLAVFHARDSNVSELEGARKSGKNNKYRFKRYAASFINKKLESDRYPNMEDARGAFLAHVIEIVDGIKKPPKGWAKDEFDGFLGKPDKFGRRLKAQYGQKLTRPKLNNWL